MKQEIINQIQDLVENADTGPARDLIRKMIKPLVESFEKEDIIEPMIDEILEFLKPVNKQVTAEAYEKFYTEEQLIAYFDFLKQNPWFTQINSEFATWCINENTNRTQDLYKELFDKYLSDTEEYQLWKNTLPEPK